MQKPFTVDFSKENASLQIFPSEPLLSSRKAGWNNIQLEYYLLPAHEAPEHLPEQNLVVLLHQPMKKLKRLLGDDFKDEHIQTGDIVVSPANVSHSACWDEEASFTLLFFETDFIARAAYEFIDPDSVEILPYFARPDPVIYEIGLVLKLQLESHRQVSQIYVDSVASFLAYHLLEHYCVGKHTITKNTKALPHKDLRLVVDYINAHLDHNIGLTQLASLVDVSRYHFARLFKQSTGVSPHQYLIERRLERATGLLVSTKLAIAEIAERSGFSSHSHLCLAFRQHLSVSPDKYRQMH